MSIPLLLSLFLFSAGSSGPSTTPAETPVTLDRSALTISQPMPEAPSDFDRIQIGNSFSSDRVCLNIHAFIFKTNDDRIPELVRETTCMPASGAAAKKVNGNVQPKLVPATGGNSF